MIQHYPGWCPRALFENVGASGQHFLAYEVRSAIAHPVCQKFNHLFGQFAQPILH